MPRLTSQELINIRSVIIRESERFIKFHYDNTETLSHELELNNYEKSDKGWQGSIYSIEKNIQQYGSGIDLDIETSYYRIFKICRILLPCYRKDKYFLRSEFHLEFCGEVCEKYIYGKVTLKWEEGKFGEKIRQHSKSKFEIKKIDMNDTKPNEILKVEYPNWEVPFEFNWNI